MANNRKRSAADMPGGGLDELLDDLYRDGHISPLLYRAGKALVVDLQAPHGDSGGLVGQTSPKVQTGAREPLRPPGGPRGIVETDKRLNRMHPHERHLMRRLVLGKEMARGTLEDLGRLSSGYKTAKMRRAVAVGRIVAFLHTQVEIYEPG